MRKQQAHQAPVRQARKRSKWPRVAFFSSQALLPKDMDVPSTKPGLGGRFLGGASSPLGMEVEACSEQVKVGAAFGGLSQESESDRMVLNAAQDLWQVWVESPVDPSRWFHWCSLFVSQRVLEPSSKLSRCVPGWDAHPFALSFLMFAHLLSRLPDCTKRFLSVSVLSTNTRDSQALLCREMRPCNGKPAARDRSKLFHLPWRPQMLSSAFSQASFSARKRTFCKLGRQVSRSFLLQTPSRPSPRPEPHTVPYHAMIYRRFAFDVL